MVKRWANQGDLAVIGKPLLQLEAIKGLEFETSLPAQWISQIHVGDEYQLKLHNTRKSITTKVSHIIHSANRVTQTCQIKLALPQLNNVEAGLSGQVDFVIAKDKQLLIPESALIKRAGVQGVFRVDKNHQAVFTPVQIERNWKQKRIILSGLNAKESVVINPPASLRDGTIINAKKAAAK